VPTPLARLDLWSARSRRSRKWQLRRGLLHNDMTAAAFLAKDNPLIAPLQEENKGTIP